MAAMVAASSGSQPAAHSKLASESSPSVSERARGRRTAMRSACIIAASTFWPASMHRPRKAWRTSRSTPCTGSEIWTCAAGMARKAGFV
jgi:hypothetical protein